MPRPSIPRSNSFISPDVLNPFISPLQLRWYHWIKIGFMSVTIAPIRLVFVLSSLGFVFLIARLATIGSTDETWKKPVTGYRRFMRFIAVKCFRLTLFFSGFHTIQVRGKRADSNEAMILVIAPHSTFFDMFSFIMGRTLSPIAKAGVPKSISRVVQAVLVERGDANSRGATIDTIIKRTDHSKGLPQIALFPEGTCTNRSCLINFKAGAFVAGVPVQPLLLRYPNELDTVTWTWEGLSLMKLWWLTMCQFNTKVEIEYLPVYKPNAAEIADPKLYANNVRIVMARALNIPVTDHSYEDCRLMEVARRHSLPMADGILEFSKISRKLSLDFESVKGMFSHYANMAGSCSKEVTLEVFADHLGVPVSSAVIKLFNLYDRNGSGIIDFREYVIGMTLVAAPANTDDTVKFAFNLFDPDNKGFINKEDFHKILSTAFKMDQADCNKLFCQVDTDNSGVISYEAFDKFAKQHPEYARLFTIYQEYETDVAKSKQDSDDLFAHHEKTE